MEVNSCEYFPINSIVHGQKIRSPRITFNNNATFDLSHVQNDFGTGIQLPCACDILGRFLFLSEETAVKIANAKTIIASEIEKCWINLNVYPLSRVRINKKLSDFIENFRYIKQRWSDPKYSKQAKFVSCCQSVHTALAQPGFDIRTNDKARIEQLEVQHDIKMTEEDVQFLEDNICGKRKMRAKLDLHWVRMKKEEEKKAEKRELKRKRMSDELEKQRHLYDKHSFEYPVPDIDQDDKSSDEE